LEQNCVDFIAAENPDFPEEEKAIAIPRDFTFVNNPSPEISSTSANISYSHDDIFGSSLQAQAYYRASEQSTIPFPGNFVFINSTDEQTWGGRLQIETPIAETAEILWGVDVEQQQNSENTFFELDNDELEQGRVVQVDEFIGYPEYDLDSLGIFAQGFSAPDFDNIFQGVDQDFDVEEDFQDLQPQKVDEYGIGIRGSWNRV
jgi:iron complex outermembrane receptor protein